VDVNLAVLWDVENVTPSADSFFVDGLLEYARQIGNISSAVAIGNWSSSINNTLAVNISEKGFELIHLPQPEEKNRRRKNSSDFVLITKATEMIFQYPHIKTYILLTGDIDFRPLLQTLKKHGKKIIVVCDSNTASEHLLEFADEYTDYRTLIPDEEEEELNGEDELEPLKREDAFTLLAEAVDLMIRKKKIPTPGSVKVRMQLLNENFSGDVEGYSSWRDFLNDALRCNVIRAQSTPKGMTLSPYKITSSEGASDIPVIIRHLMDVIQAICPHQKWIHFAQVSDALIERGVNIKEYKYPKLKKLIMDAEKRDLVETRSSNMKWYVRRKE